MKRLLMASVSRNALATADMVPCPFRATHTLTEDEFRRQLTMYGSAMTIIEKKQASPVDNP